MDDLYEPTSDYDDQMEAVRAGYVDPDDVHCKHGTFIGSWAGPDYLCQWCEMPDGDREYDLAQLRQRRAQLLGPKLDEVLRAMHAAGPDAIEPLFRRYLRLLRWGVRSHLFWNPDELNGPCPHVDTAAGRLP
jgi:hypothetical protein